MFVTSLILMSCQPLRVASGQIDTQHSNPHPSHIISLGTDSLASDPVTTVSLTVMMAMMLTMIKYY